MPTPSQADKPAGNLAGNLAGSVSPDLWRALADCAAALSAVAAAAAGDGAAVPALRVLPAASGELQLCAALNLWLEAKARAGVSDDYLAQLRYTADKFSAGRRRLPLAAVSGAVVEDWLAGNDWKPRTRAGQLGNLRGFFAWCIRRGFMAACPLRAVEPPRAAAPTAPGIHTPAEVAAVLRAGLALGNPTGKLLAVRYFTGLRSAEVARLELEDFRAGFVEVTAAKAKTRKRRLVPVAPVLAAWLALPGDFLPADREGRAARAARAAGVRWPRNVTRHSFCSYRLAASGSAAATALEAGHSEAVLFAVYRETVRPEAAAAFWSLTPAAVQASGER